MSNPPREDWPEDISEMRKIPVVLPRLSPDSPGTCPVPMDHILEYIGYEAPGGEHSGSEQTKEFQLEFVRTASVESSRYWIWRFADVEGIESYVLVELKPSPKTAGAYDTVTAYDGSFGLTPEQFILAAHYDTIL